MEHHQVQLAAHTFTLDQLNVTVECIAQNQQFSIGTWNRQAISCRVFSQDGWLYYGGAQRLYRSRYRESGG